MKHYSILDMFIDAGIDLDHVNNEGNTAMMMSGERIRNSQNVMKLFF